MRIPKCLAVLIVLMLGTGCVIANSESLSEAFVPYTETSQVVVDGIIVPEEYTGFYNEPTTGMSIYWEHDGENLHIGLVSPGTGWVGLGLGPQGTGMDGANIIIGYVNDATGVVVLSDSIGEGWLHTSDSNRGGLDNIVEKAGTQSTEGTIIEFIFPLSSGDVFDHNFEIGGTYGFFVAYHESSDDFASYHTARSETRTLQIGSPGELPPPVEVGTETVLTIAVPASVEQLKPFNISTRLYTIDGTPLEGETIHFYLITTFGDLQIGESLTNAEGFAQLEHAHPRPELIEIKAVFEGTPAFEASQTKGTVSVFIKESPGEEFSEIIRVPGTNIGISIDILILSLILIFVFGSIYVTYVRVLYSLSRVPKMGALEEIRPEELRFEEIDLERG
ncbi:MAG: DOMON domain-containing protein [Candidatus Heimdallarchaeota archaeon]